MAGSVSGPVLVILLCEYPNFGYDVHCLKSVAYGTHGHGRRHGNDPVADATAHQAPPVEYSAWMRLRAVHRARAAAASHAGSLPTGAALKRVFQHLFGPDCSSRDETRFLIFAAPIARKIAIGMANRGDRIGESDVKVQDLVEWLGWLDRFDPMCAAMIDLHYFAGLTTKQTAAALHLPPATVVRDLRFAKAWLQTKLI